MKDSCARLALDTNAMEDEGVDLGEELLWTIQRSATFLTFARPAFHSFEIARFLQSRDHHLGTPTVVLERILGVRLINKLEVVNAKITVYFLTSRGSFIALICGHIKPNDGQTFTDESNCRVVMGISRMMGS